MGLNKNTIDLTKGNHQSKLTVSRYDSDQSGDVNGMMVSGIRSIPESALDGSGNAYSLRYSPSKNDWGYLLYNDNFPNKGDNDYNDYNDLVVAYKYINIHNEDNKIVAQELFFYPIDKFSAATLSFGVRMIKDLPIETVTYEHNAEVSKSFILMKDEGAFTSMGLDYHPVYTINDIQGYYKTNAPPMLTLSANTAATLTSKITTKTSIAYPSNLKSPLTLTI